MAYDGDRVDHYPVGTPLRFICLRAMGMSANLLSMGAIDFGIIIDGAVVMVEGLFVALDRKAREVGMPAFNLMSKMGIIRHTAKDRAKAVFFSKLIIITALVPIFSFQKVEGKMFSPLAYTLGFALLGALIFTLTLVPVLSSMLLKKEVREKHNPFLAWINRKSIGIFDWCHARKKRTITFATLVAAIGIWCFTLLGSEFLPQLNEGSIYIRATLPQSISLDESVTLANRCAGSWRLIRRFVRSYRKPAAERWHGRDRFLQHRVSCGYISRERVGKRTLESGSDREDARGSGDLSGVDFNFSQPISDNVEEAASGVKGSIAVKVFGKTCTSRRRWR